MVETSGRAAEEGSVSRDRQTSNRCSKTEQQIIVSKCVDRISDTKTHDANAES